MASPLGEEGGSLLAVASCAPSVVAAAHTASTRVTYWHGGVSGLHVGDYILPPSVTGTQHILSVWDGHEEVRPGYRRDRVYLTGEMAVAEVFAAMCFPSSGWVYRVVPEGQLEVDPDSGEPGMSWVCARARIVEVIELDLLTVIAILTEVEQGRRAKAGGVA
ncbi:hypothetical protein [Archangium lansingense]|uniref:Uncharacterized protein n=1 Tax=Archangium lansingense TaxID=2995310 RepID=A0ABT4AFH6_9BACT|nr:hypothetical protein [Archangium lansinium]MCY1080321.1 hypothetical protein [Archangium lansinium]